MNDTVLEIEALSIGLPPSACRRHAVHDVSLRLRAGRTLCVVGESGSGKSMLAHAIIGLLPAPGIRATAGRIVFGGEDLGFVHQVRADAVPLKHLHDAQRVEIGAPATVRNALLAAAQLDENVANREAVALGDQHQSPVLELLLIGAPKQRPKMGIQTEPFELGEVAVGRQTKR
ncbi:MAG: ATP-binding cassette domain-containing protein, partial [Burkholderia vietnamiensis]|nr:ATP-binding cassette domain-containing protein [Burkholderia vietnamiensis]